VERELDNEELLAFAESLLSGVGPQLRERRVLEEAIEQHRQTWLTLYAVATQLKKTKTTPPT
jgi:hypothetical protein